MDFNNSAILYKSKIVIRGDKAVYGSDYFESYSPVAKNGNYTFSVSINCPTRVKTIKG